MSVHSMSTIAKHIEQFAKDGQKVRACIFFDSEEEAQIGALRHNLGDGKALVWMRLFIGSETTEGKESKILEVPGRSD